MKLREKLQSKQYSDHTFPKYLDTSYDSINTAFWVHITTTYQWSMEVTASFLILIHTNVIEALLRTALQCFSKLRVFDILKTFRYCVLAFLCNKKLLLWGYLWKRFQSILFLFSGSCRFRYGDLYNSADSNMLSRYETVYGGSMSVLAFYCLKHKDCFGWVSFFHTTLRELLFPKP